MALFSSNTKTSKKNAASAVSDARMAVALKRPWFSEKALISSENGVYVFEVSPSATKIDVANAIIAAYKVTPMKVRMVNLPAKKVSLRTRRGVGTRARRHKAYVYLKEGDTITFA